MTTDPFGAAGLRSRVLAAWRDSPARFRADANVEDDLALVGYRDRVIVELAQNAADAAARAGTVGRLVLTLSAGRLGAANTGAPLDAAGVESLSVARASAKADQPDAVGRFGVGFAAVLSVSDAPRAVSALGAVEWSRDAAARLVASVPELAAARGPLGDRVPVLRLPFAIEAVAPAGADTLIELPLRDAVAEAAVRDQLAALDATLLLALPALGEVVVRVDGQPERVLRTDIDGPRVAVYDGQTPTRWWVARAHGALPTELVASAPATERQDEGWQVTWAIPVDDHDAVADLPATVARVVRAPTATDDPMTLPAVLIASYPLDATRRRVTPGVVADYVTARAAETLAAAMTTLPASAHTLRLVPVGLADGAVDGALYAAVLGQLSEVRWLPAAGDPGDLGGRRRPRDASVAPDALVAPLADVLPGLLPAGWSGPALTALEVSRPSVADLVDALAAADMTPRVWRDLYAAFDEAVPAGPQRDALGALPVPLADGGLTIGPRGVTLADEGTGGLSVTDLAALGVRLVHPEAAHPLLRTLGAADGTPRALLDLPQVRAAVEASFDAEDPAPVATATLSVLAATAASSDELPWLGELALPDDDGQWRPACELLLPDGLMARVVVADSGLGIVSRRYVEDWGAATLVATGVLDGPAVLRVADPTGPGYDLDGEDEWWATLPTDAALSTLVAVRDLELVDPRRLPEVVERLAAPPYREVLLTPAWVIDHGAPRRFASYTAWWLSSRPVIGGAAPRDLRLASSDPVLAGLYDEAPADLDAELARALGVVSSLDDVDPDELLTRLADESRQVSRTQLRELYGWLADRVAQPLARVRVVRHGIVEVVEAVDAVVVDSPDLVPLLGDRAVVPVSAGKARPLAEALGLTLASEEAEFEVVSAGVADHDAIVHDPLRVLDVDGQDRVVAWRLVDSTLHVDRSRRSHGLGRGRAWREGDWSQRHRRTEELITGDLGILLEAEDDFDKTD